MTLQYLRDPQLSAAGAWVSGDFVRCRPQGPSREHFVTHVEKLDGLLCKDQWNIVYLSGYFHSQTERPEALWVPATGEPTLFAPGLDRDLVSTWWIRDAEYYFDYPHAEANNDPRAATVVGPSGTVDLWKWMASGLNKRGFSAKKIGLDWDAPESTLRKLKEVLPQATFRAAPDITMQMRIIKSPEEVALTQRAIDYSDQMLEFCRKYVLERGTTATDFDVRHAAVTSPGSSPGTTTTE